ISLKRFYGIANFEDLNTAMTKATPAISKTGSVGNELIMQLPSTLALDLDLNVGAGFFLNVAGSFLLKNSDQDYQVAGSYSYFQITPRFESKGFGIYLPITHNAINNYNAGIALNLGSLFVGSGSLLSTFISGETRQLDIHAGFRFGLLQQKNETKTKTKKKEETIE
ncbi:MAG: hypothetical protein JWQ30_1406, partial [Sediminibacterium sp.]|nr:hypothetical protein [Sediminibacterium sp.]